MPFKFLTIIRRLLVDPDELPLELGQLQRPNLRPLAEVDFRMVARCPRRHGVMLCQMPLVRDAGSRSRYSSLA